MLTWSIKASRKFRPLPVLLSRANVSLGSAPSVRTPLAGGTVAAVLLLPCPDVPWAARESQGQHCQPDLGRLLASLAIPETAGRPRTSVWCHPGQAELLERDLPCCKTQACTALLQMHVPESGSGLQMGNHGKLFHAVTGFTYVILVTVHAG